MVSLAAVLLMLLAFAVVAYPLMRPAARLVTGGSASDSELEDLIRERDSAYAAIKELEFEYQLGNLSPEDFQGLRDQYAERAARALSRLDAARERVAAAPVVPLAPAPAPAPDVELLPPGVCPLCRQAVEPEDRFCGECGAMLSRFCRACGAQRDSGATMCVRCGAPLEAGA